MSTARRPRGLRGVARVGLLAAWVVFWLNTALFPCCAVAATLLTGHAESGSQSAPTPLPPHYSDAANFEPLGYGPDSPCNYTLIPDSPIIAANEVLTPDRSPLQWFAIDAPFATGFIAVHRAADFTLERAPPPPPLRLYQRNQRLLI